MDDPKEVQAEQVSEEEQVSPEVKPGDKPKEEPQPQPLTEERVQQMMAEATALAKEQGKREMQGIKDREVAEAQRRASQAEARASAYNAGFAGLDEETRQQAEQAKLRAENQYYQTREQQEQAQREFDRVIDTFEANMTQYITDLGIDPSDKRIVWGERGNQNLNERQGSILSSVAKIQKENVKVAESEMEKRLAAMIEADNLKNRQDLNLDSVDTSTSASGGDSDAEFMGKFGSGELPMTKAHVERHKKIQEQYK